VGPITMGTYHHGHLSPWAPITITITMGTYHHGHLSPSPSPWAPITITMGTLTSLLL